MSNITLKITAKCPKDIEHVDDIIRQFNDRGIIMHSEDGITQANYFLYGIKRVRAAELLYSLALQKYIVRIMYTQN